MTIDELIQREMQPQSFRWWGRDYQNVVPALVDEVLGDGAALLKLTSLDCRPYHWLIRVDSSLLAMDDEKAHDYVDYQVVEAIANCFGECDHDDTCNCRFPVLILDTGYNWDVVTP